MRTIIDYIVTKVQKGKRIITNRQPIYKDLGKGASVQNSTKSFIDSVQGSKKLC